jgi:hypothetical protein
VEINRWPYQAWKFSIRKKIKQRDQELSYATRNLRDKKTQVISYLTAEEAERVGLDKVIRAYPVNNFNVVNCENYRIIKRVSDQSGCTECYRKRNHISEITVLETDGKRYVYGIPVYNVKQKDVTFSVNNMGADGIVSYSDEESTTDNSSGSDGYFQSEEIPPYAHSFLLTALLSSDYVDVKDDGITDDDLGDAVKFNYTRLNYGAGRFVNQKWRTPQAGNNSASFSEGLKTESQDNKGFYSYGERESWYVHSLESKNMIAVFYLGDRNDNIQPQSEKGGNAASAAIKKLEKIELYARAELVANGANPSKIKPIKTVIFSYSYKLCKGSPLNGNANEGKLTLDSLWFTYNGNKQRRNIYRFAYDHNFDYKRNSQDKWGGYKDADDNVNPSGLSNVDFPYTGYGNSSNKTKFNEYASAWMLNKVLLPSGSQMNIEYEADDYGYVQNRRACQMFQIAGFGSAPEQGYSPSKSLYGSAPSTGNFRLGDYDYVFIDLPEDIVNSDPASAKKEIYSKYLESLKQLILKLWIRMPSDYQNASGFEPVTVFSTIKDYGILPANSQQSVNKKRIWIRVNRVKNDASPMAATAVQFLRDNFPAKAFPGNNVDPKATAVEQVVRALVSMAPGIQNAFSNFEKKARMDYMCMTVHESNAFIRLADPTLSKTGGGYRVKKITISDGWNKMTEKRDQNGSIIEPGEHESLYGQEYDYSTDVTILEIKQKISSGVATYEPQIGAEENPFKEVLNYENQNPAGPTQQGFIDMPFGETFFPAPMVGYSKVRVRSIHNKTNKNIKSGVGTQESAFYTSKDFPYTADFTDFDPTSNVRFKSDPIMRFLKIDVREMVTLSQGFRVVINDMNGKVRSQASYAENDLNNPINYTEYFYRIEKKGENAYKLNNTLQVASKNGQIMSKEVGKDIEVMVDFREHKSETNSGGAHFNTDGFPLPPFPMVTIPVLFKPPMHDENTFRSVSVLKVVNEFGIVDSVVQVDKGSRVSTRNLVYDAETGDVLISRTQNEFNYPIYNTNYPAYWAYAGMQPAYQNIDVVYSNVVFRNGFIESSHVNQNLFESGDEIYVNDLANTTGPLNSAACAIVTGQSILPKSYAFKIWALDIRKDDRSATAPRKLIFIDRDGNPYNSKGASIRIIRSGKRNLLGASASSFVSLTNPIKGSVIQFNSTDLVINSSAVEFKEKWRGEEAFYLVERQQLINAYYPIRTQHLSPIASMKAIQYKKHWDGSTFFALQEDPPSLEARHFSFGNFSQGPWPSKHTYQDVRSWLKYDLSGVPPDGIILEAKLSLSAYPYTHTNFAIPAEVISGPNNPHQSHMLPAGYWSNAFTLMRMFHPWSPATDYNSWRYTHFRGAEGDYTKDFAYAEGTDPSWQNMSYSLTSTDRRLTITNMFKSMVADRNNPEHPAAFRMGLARYSWGGRVNESRANFNLFRSGYIDYRYFKPSEKYGLPGNPATPPPGQDVFIVKEMATTRNCYSVYSRLFMNPYNQGILGNWRSHRSNVFYGERKESDPTVATNIKTDGAIKDFVPFWTFTANGLAKSNNVNWVWNTEITQFNRKGLEIENRDPLNPSRYNAGLYGYNDNLPIAVVNNSQYKESAFDGFEDYTYKDKICAGDCKTERENSARHMQWTNMNGNVIDDNTSHTGRSSLKITAGSYVEASHNLTASSTTVEPDLNINMVSTSYSITSVNQIGTGLKAYYYWDRNNLTTPFTTRIEPGINLWFGGKGNCSNNNNSQLPPNLRCNDIAVIWKGKIVFPETGVYKFRFNVNDEAQLFLDGVAVNFPNCSGTASGYNYVSCNSVDLSRQKGQIQNFELRFKQWGGYGGVTLYWQVPGNANWVTIPKGYLFPDGASTTGAVTTQTYTCVQPEKIKVLSNGLIDKFSPAPGKKMLISAWVKQDGSSQAYKYDNNSIEIRFNGSSSISATFKPAGIIIEGWQRYEGVFEIPPNAVSIQVRLKNEYTSNVYFDDVRLHPYNANMKSFVYHPVTLRLMAEMDENNYSSFYEYDDDGTLIRVKKETREGVKTIKETRSAIQRNIQSIQ